MKYNTKLTFKIFWQHASRYKLAMFVLSTTIIMAGSLAIIEPLFYKKFFDVLVAGGSREVLVSLLGTILTLYLIEWALWRIAGFINSYFQTRVMGDLSITCFNYLHKHSFSFFNNNFVGSLVKRVNRFYHAFEGVADACTWDLLPIIVDVILVIIVLSTRSPFLGVGLGIWVTIFCLVNYAFSRYKLKYDVERSEMDSKVTGILADTITNHSNVKLFVGYDREKKYFERMTRILNKMRKFTWDISSVFEAFQMLLMICLEIGIFYFAISLWEKGVLTVGDFVLIQAYLLRVFMKLWDVGRIIRRFYEHLADAEEMTEILDQPHDILDVKNAKRLVVSNGQIEYRNVNFYYHKTRKIIDHFNLTIHPQEKIAFVGPSGAGKSTIVKLLLRQHDITDGTIEIDNQRISHITQESLWENISLVPQDPILFHRTLMENIRYGRPDATDGEVKDAAKKAHCHEFINEFPEKYDTYVGERGVKLSGGERQRVAIARAI
ncbi:MAG: hypothetical protein A2479_00655, partial [Candidatus Magasanikbacteria bacterium RIFOXYC2_FULL_39_8]